MADVLGVNVLTLRCLVRDGCGSRRTGSVPDRRRTCASTSVPSSPNCVRRRRGPGDHGGGGWTDGGVVTMAPTSCGGPQDGCRSRCPLYGHPCREVPSETTIRGVGVTEPAVWMALDGRKGGGIPAFRRTPKTLTRLFSTALPAQKGSTSTPFPVHRVTGSMLYQCQAVWPCKTTATDIGVGMPRGSGRTPTSSPTRPRPGDWSARKRSSG